MNKHTPGPWTNEDYTIIASDGSVIADVHSLDDFPCIDQDNDKRQLAALTKELEANGALIGAAPDLYASLKEIVDQWGSPNTPKWHRAKAALAKAEGQ